MDSDKTIKYIATAVKIILAMSLLYLITNKANFHDLKLTTANIDGYYLFYGIFFFIISICLEVIKLYALIRDIETLNNTIKITLIGNFFSNFLPSNIGGDVYKIFYLGRKINAIKASVYVLIDRIIGIFILLISSFVVLISTDYKLNICKILLSISNKKFFFPILTVFLFSLILFFTTRYRSKLQATRIIRDYLNKIITSFKEVTPSKYGAAGLSSGCFHFSRVMGVYCFLLALGQKVGASEILLVMAFTAVISLLPISIGALGLREGALVVGFGFFGVNYTVATSIALLLRVILSLPALCGGIWLMLDKKIVEQRQEYPCK